MKKIPILIALLITCATLSAQTKLVAHKSHSGTNANFTKALHNDLFSDVMLSDFGEPIPYIRKELIHRMDSLIYIKDSTFMVVQSTWHTQFEFETDKKITDQRFEIQRYFMHLPILLEHPSPEDSIISILQKNGRWKVQFDSLQLVNFDLLKETKAKASVQPSKKEQRKLQKRQKKEAKKAAKSEMQKAKQTKKEKVKPSGMVAGSNTHPGNTPPPVVASKWLFLVGVLGMTLLFGLWFQFAGHRLHKS